MSSRLFNLASAAARALAGQAPRTALRGQQAARQIGKLIEAVTAPPSPKAKQDAGSSLQALLDALGPLGRTIIEALGGRASLRGQGQIEAAIAMIQALGGDVLVRDPKSPHYQRGLRAARQLLEETDRLPEPQPRTSPPRQPPPRGPAAPAADEWPDEHGVTVLGRGTSPAEADWVELSRKEILTPDSSNVYSFTYDREMGTDRQGLGLAVGILYVTFRRWVPGQKGPKPNQPGPTYAYYNVPLTKYRSFTKQARLSAGGAVWDYLRVRGSKWDHRQPYRLVGGVSVPLGGVYVPRKSTKGGLRNRTLPAPGVGRRAFRRSELPEMDWSPNRAAPSRGTPNRGTPNRGTP